CFVHHRKELRAGAMAAKSEPGIYLGHSEERNLPIVLMLRSGKLVATRDVRFLNNRFSHMQAYRKGQEEMDAIVDGSSDSLEPTMYHSDSEEASDGTPDEMPAQRGVLQPSAEERKESNPLE